VYNSILVSLDGTPIDPTIGKHVKQLASSPKSSPVLSSATVLRCNFRDYRSLDSHFL
jgi:hypothetical protein